MSLVILIVLIVEIVFNRSYDSEQLNPGEYMLPEPDGIIGGDFTEFECHMAPEATVNFSLPNGGISITLDDLGEYEDTPNRCGKFYSANAYHLGYFGFNVIVPELGDGSMFEFGIQEGHDADESGTIAFRIKGNDTRYVRIYMQTDEDTYIYNYYSPFDMAGKTVHFGIKRDGNCNNFYVNPDPHNETEGFTTIVGGCYSENDLVLEFDALHLFAQSLLYFDPYVGNLTNTSHERPEPPRREDFVVGQLFHELEWGGRVNFTYTGPIEYIMERIYFAEGADDPTFVVTIEPDDDDDEPDDDDDEGVTAGEADDSNYNLLYLLLTVPVLVGCVFCSMVTYCCMCCILIWTVICYKPLRKQVGKELLRGQKLGGLYKTIAEGNVEFDDIDRVEKAEQSKRMATFEVNQNLFQIDMKDLKIVKSVGKGGYCVVYLALWKGEKEVAFKVFDTKLLGESGDDFSSFERELSLIASLNHPNLPDFYGCSLKPPRVGIVMEYCGKGSLNEYIPTHKVRLKAKIRILFEVICGMVFLHERKVIHRDLKPENILLNNNLTAKVVDFGLSKVVEDINVEKTRNVGTSCFMAPEVFRGIAYDEKADIFSYGVIMWCVISEIFQPYGKADYGIQSKVASDPEFRPDIEKCKEKANKRDWLLEIIVACWEHKPMNRPSFETLEKMFRKHYIPKGESKRKTKKITKKVEEDEEEEEEEEESKRRRRRRRKKKAVEELAEGSSDESDEE